MQSPICSIMFIYVLMPFPCGAAGAACCRLVLSWEDLQLDVPGAPGLLVSLLSSRVGLFAARWGFTNALCGTFLWLSNCMCYSNCAYIYRIIYIYALFISIDIYIYIHSKYIYIYIFKIYMHTQCWLLDSSVMPRTRASSRVSPKTCCPESPAICQRTWPSGPSRHTWKNSEQRGTHGWWHPRIFRAGSGSGIFLGGKGPWG